MKRLLCLLVCVGALGLPVMAEEADCYCFAQTMYADQDIAGICLTQLPDSRKGAVMLGQRQLRPGDVLTPEQMEQVIFVPSGEMAESTASISYLPVFADGISGEATRTFAIRSRENKAPVAEDAAFETYKNLEVCGQLRVHDPEGQMLQFNVTRPPKRGTIEIREDGSFTYTPKKNKVGVDSFTFTASDPAGKLSRETTVTVTILKPTEARQYCDTMGKSCRFAAEWMKNTGIFVGESLGDNPCFSPDRLVTRGEFLTMLVKTMELPTDADVSQTGYTDAPDWLKPYLAAALRSGMIAALPAQDTFGAEMPVTAEEAASLLCTALRLEQSAMSGSDLLRLAAENGFALAADQLVTRGDAAQLLYRASQLRQERLAERF